jgi:hypothetical protein
VTIFRSSQTYYTHNLFIFNQIGMIGGGGEIVFRSANGVRTTCKRFAIHDSRFTIHESRLLIHCKRLTEEGVEAYRDVKHQGSHVFSKIGSQMAVRLSALRTGHALLRRNIIFLFLVLMSVSGSVNPRA